MIRRRACCSETANHSRTFPQGAVPPPVCPVQRLRAICRAMGCSPRQCSAASRGSTPRNCNQISGGCAAVRSPYRTQWRIVMSRSAQARKPELNDVADRLAALDWTRMGNELDAHGCATTGSLLSADECAALSSRYEAEGVYRSRVIMG